MCAPRGVKKGDRYVAVVCGNTKRKTAIERGKTSFAYANVFHFLIRGAKSAMVEVLLMEDEKLVKDKIVGSVKVRYHMERRKGAAGCCFRNRARIRKASPAGVVRRLPQY